MPFISSALNCWIMSARFASRSLSGTPNGEWAHIQPYTEKEGFRYDLQAIKPHSQPPPTPKLFGCIVFKHHAAKNEEGYLIPKWIRKLTLPTFQLNAPVIISIQLKRWQNYFPNLSLYQITFFFNRFHSYRSQLRSQWKCNQKAGVGTRL